MSANENNNFEVWTWVLLAVIASLLAIVDLIGGKYGDDELISINEKSNAYQRYQSKGMKQNITEGQYNLLNTLIESNTIDQSQVGDMKNLLTKLDEKIKRYEKEQTEIMEWSTVVGQAQRVQDIDGEMGKVIGAKQWEERSMKLGEVGDTFDLAMLYFQISLVIGAIALGLQNQKMKNIFFIIMLLLACVAIYYSVDAYIFAQTIV